MRSGQKQSLAVDGIDGRWLPESGRNAKHLATIGFRVGRIFKPPGSRFRLGQMCRSEVRECVHLNRCGLTVGGVGAE
ncbi:hypothetical protein BconGalA64_10060 [Burkholderia contaminans]|nr:hypothetical protein BconGalA64_10060 [Burkholderia contaminans]